MSDQFLSINLDDVPVGEPLEVTIYIYIDFRFITFRSEGDKVDRMAYDRLMFKKVRNLFVQEVDAERFATWQQKRKEIEAPVAPLPPGAEGFAKVREDVHRKTMDIFQSDHPDKIVTQTLALSKKLVEEVMKFPYSVNTLGMLQTYSKGTVDHSVNVSILSVYLAMQMGYTHSLILQHVGTGGLLHDIGKCKVPLADDDSPAQIAAKMLAHPELGLRLIEGHAKVPNEVKMIISQHHECWDGNGYPKKLRGNAIYDLARVVQIANVFDELVGDAKGNLVDRQRAAVKELDQVLYRRFDPQKLDKAVKILKLGI